MSGRSAAGVQPFPITDFSGPSAKEGYEDGPKMYAEMVPGAQPQRFDFVGGDIHDRLPDAWEPPQKPILSVRDRGRGGRDTGKDRSDRGKYRMEDHLAFQRYMKESLQRQVRERQAADPSAAGVGSTVLQEKRAETKQQIAVVQPETAEEVVNTEEPPQTVYPDFILKGRPYTRFDPGQEPLFDVGHDPRMRLEYGPAGPDYVLKGDPYVSFQETGPEPPGYVQRGKRPAYRSDRPQTTGSGSRNRVRGSITGRGDVNVPSAEGMFDTSNILVRESGSGGHDGSYGNSKLRQQLIEKAQIEAREYTKVNQQFAAKEGQLLEQNRQAQAALAAQQAQFEAAKAEYASYQDTTSGQAQAVLAKMNKMQKDGDALMTEYTKAQQDHATLKQQMADQHQALLDKDAAYGTLQGQLTAAQAEIEANKRALLDTTEMDQMKAQQEAMKKAADGEVDRLRNEIANLNKKMNEEGNEITRDYLREKARADDLQETLRDYQKDATDHITEAGRIGQKIHKDLEDARAREAELKMRVADETMVAGMRQRELEKVQAEAAAQLKAASDAVAAKDAALRDMEQQYKDHLARSRDMTASELVAIQDANQKKLAEVIATSNGANEEMKKQIEAINAQLAQGGDEGGAQYNHTVNVLAELRALLVQSVQYHETHISAYQANTTIVEASDARFDEIKRAIEEAMATQKPVVIPPSPSLVEIVDAVAGRLAADKAAKVVASGTGMPKNEGDMGSGTMTIVLVMMIGFMLFWYFRKKKRR